MDGTPPYPAPSTRAESKANRQTAIAAGLKRYIGQPCRNCGSRERWISAGDCNVCKKESNNKRYATDPEYRERVRKQSSEWSKRKWATDPMFRLRRSQYNCHYLMRKRIERLKQQRDELYA